MSAPRTPAGPRTGFARRNRSRNLAYLLPDSLSRRSSQSEVSSNRTTTEDFRQIPWGHASSEHARQPSIEVNNLLQECPFFVVDLVEGTSFYGATTFDSTVIPREFPGKVMAIIIKCMLSRRADVERYLMDLRAANKPIIIFCVDEGEDFHTDQVLDAHGRFLDLGANDMVLQDSPSKDFRLDLFMRVRSAMRADKVRRVEVDMRLEDQQKTILWPFVHRILPGFPKLSNANDSQLASRNIKERIQAGTFGTVFKCMNTENREPEVVKAIRKDKVYDFNEVKDVWNEIVLLKKLEHPNVVACKFARQTSTDIFIFMDYAGPSNLLAYLKESSTPTGERVKTTTGINIAGQILSGLSHCHENAVSHRDLKPENIVVMLTDGVVRIRIVDFGMAIDSTKACTELVGTVPFIAPEVVTRSDEQYYPACADMWSCGVIFLEILCGVGKLSRMLQWSQSPRPGSRYRKDLERFFSMENRITASVEEDIGMAGSASFPGNAHVSLLGMLGPDPRCRCDAVTAIEALTQDAGIVVSTAYD